MKCINEFEVKNEKLCYLDDNEIQLTSDEQTLLKTFVTKNINYKFKEYALNRRKVFIN